MPLCRWDARDGRSRSLLTARRGIFSRPATNGAQAGPRTAALSGRSGSAAVPADTFDAIVSLHAVIHVPRAEHAAVFAEFERVLEPGGRLLTALGNERWEGNNEDWLETGTEMAWSFHGRKRNRELLAEAGFSVTDVETVDDELGGVSRLSGRERSPIPAHSVFAGGSTASASVSVTRMPFEARWRIWRRTKSSSVVPRVARMTSPRAQRGASSARRAVRPVDATHPVRRRRARVRRPAGRYPRRRRGRRPAWSVRRGGTRQAASPGWRVASRR